MKLLAAALVLGALAASPAWADQPVDQLLACRRVPDSAARLECFDRAADTELTAKKPDDAPSPSPSPSKPSKVESSIVQISQPAVGRVEFTLENGQVWRQMDAENARSAKVGDRVVVYKVFMGAHWLKIQGGHEWRVTLVR